MKKILIAFVIVMSTTAFAADGVAPAQGGSSNTDTTVVHKAKKKKKSKKGKKAKAAAPAEPAAPAGGAPAGQ